MTVNIINGGSRAEQRKKVLFEELKSQNIIDFKLWEGVKDPTSVIRSISLSHKEIVQDAKDKGLKMVCIAEDDIMFLGDLAFAYFIFNIPEKFDIYLGGVFLGVLKDNVAERFTGMTLYIVHENFYDTFLASDNSQHIDQWLADKGMYVVCDPFIVRQHNGWSDNSQQYANYDQMFTHRNLYNKK